MVIGHGLQFFGWNRDSRCVWTGSNSRRLKMLTIWKIPAGTFVIWAISIRIFPNFINRTRIVFPWKFSYQDNSHQENPTQPIPHEKNDKKSRSHVVKFTETNEKSIFQLLRFLFFDLWSISYSLLFCKIDQFWVQKQSYLKKLRSQIPENWFDWDPSFTG